MTLIMEQIAPNLESNEGMLLRKFSTMGILKNNKPKDCGSENKQPLPNVRSSNRVYTRSRCIELKVGSIRITASVSKDNPLY